jgi:hypothetical protein
MSKKRKKAAMRSAMAPTSLRMEGFWREMIKH